MLEFLDPKLFVSNRAGEEKIGEKATWFTGNWKSELEKFPGRFVLLGVLEDFGPRANLGRGGATSFFPEFLKKFCNMQHNKYLQGNDLAILGQIKPVDLEVTESVDVLREQVSRLDKQLCEILVPIFKARKTPIFVGGGHNNSYPLIKSFSKALNAPVQCLNIDAHADFRNLEGRHSGNGFSYAFKEGYLKQYNLLGLHKNYNGQKMLESMEKETVQHLFLEDFPAGDNQLAYLKQWIAVKLHSSLAFGLEIDLDSIAFAHSSAISPIGIDFSTLRSLISYIASQVNVGYLNISEGIADEQLLTPKTAAYLAADFIRAQQ
ncbi:MAG: formimidoylglutamase [Luteibaculum sp.]